MQKWQISLNRLGYSCILFLYNPRFQSHLNSLINVIPDSLTKTKTTVQSHNSDDTDLFSDPRAAWSLNHIIAQVCFYNTSDSPALHVKMGKAEGIEM